MLQQSELFADRLQRERPNSPEKQIHHAFQLCFGRDPDNEELQRSLDFVTSHNLAALCRALLNSNEFVFVP
jgi:hypothetical protein